MLLFNEQNQQIDVAALKARLKQNVENIEAPSDDEIEEDLGNYYQQANNIDLANYGIRSVPFSTLAAPASAIAFPFIGRRLLIRIKNYVCNILTATSVLDDIIDAVLKAIASLIPGGMILEPYVAKIIKYIASKGVSNFCGI